LGEDHFALTIDLQNMFEIDRQRPAATLTNALGRLG